MRLTAGGGPTIGYLEPGDSWRVSAGAVSVWVSWNGAQIPVGVVNAGGVIPGVARFMVELLPDEGAAVLTREPRKLDPVAVQRLFDAAVVFRKPVIERVRYWLTEWIGFRDNNLSRVNQSYLAKLSGTSRESVARSLAELERMGVINTSEKGKRRYVAIPIHVKH